MEKYLDGGYEGLNLRFMSPPPFPSLNFLAGYDDLRYLEITTGRLNYDLPAFGLPALEELILLTRSSRAIPGDCIPSDFGDPAVYLWTSNHFGSTIR